MIVQSFSLVPFRASEIPEIAITGHVSRQDNIIVLHYLVTGKIREILFPVESAKPCRKHDLWRSTCFEFFLALPGEPGYWEFNMSPSGDWNIYHMDSYRRIGFGEEASIQRLPFQGWKEAGAFLLDTKVDLHPIIREEQPLEVGITAIIQTRDAHETYWALAHPGSQADFHLREGFTLLLEGQTHPAQQSARGD